MVGFGPGTVMSKDPLALAAITGGPPQEAEYDAVYAAVTATERGRWFLTEFANRNRQVDTHLVMAALAPAYYALLRATGAASHRSVANGIAVAAQEQIRSIPYYDCLLYTSPSPRD